MNRDQILASIPIHLRPHVEAIARGLNEVEAQPIEKIGNIIRIFGIEGSLKLFKEALDIEAKGGIAKAYGNTNRTLGGVFFKLAKKQTPPECLSALKSSSDPAGNPLKQAAGLLRKAAHIVLFVSEELSELNEPHSEFRSTLGMSLDEAVRLLREARQTIHSKQNEPAALAPVSKQEHFTKADARRVYKIFVQATRESTRVGTDPKIAEIAKGELIAKLAKDREESPSVVHDLIKEVSEAIQNDPCELPITLAEDAYVRRDYSEAEKFALKAEEQGAPLGEKGVADRIEALILAGNSAYEKRLYAKALEHYHAALSLTSQDRDLLEWIRVQNEIGWYYYLRGQYNDQAALMHTVWRAGEVANKGLDPAVFRAHNLFAIALHKQVKYVEAEQAQRAVLAVCERVLGTEHSETLQSRNNLACVLNDQGKNIEAAKEHSAVLEIRMRVLGAEKLDTLESRTNLAIAYQSQSMFVDTAQEHRAVLMVRERVLGAEHPDTLNSRSNLAAALQRQGKTVEAEKQHRTLLEVRERVLGVLHPQCFTTCFNLSLCLKEQGKLKNALEFMRLAETGRSSVLGTEHPDSKEAKRWRHDIEAELVKKPSKKKGRKKLALRERARN